LREHLTTPTFFRRFAKAALLAACVFNIEPARADSFRGDISSGFGRILFTLDPPAHVTPAIDGSVLTLTFDRKPDIDTTLLASSLPGYIAGAHADADGKTLHLALTQSVKLHVSTDGNRVAVDLVPQTFAGKTPDLAPTEVHTPPAPVDSLPVRVGTSAAYTRLVFDWPRNVPYTVNAKPGHVTVHFAEKTTPDFAALTRVAPPWVKETAWRAENGGVTVEFDTDPGSAQKNYRSGTKIVLDIMAPKSDASAIAPADKTATAVKQAQAIADAATKLKSGDQSAQPAQTPVPQTANASPAQPAQPAQAQNTQTPAAKIAHDSITMTFPGAGSHGVAAFVRGMTAWIVLDNSPAIDTTKLAAALGDFPASVEASTDDNAAIIRIGLKQPEQIAARTEGTDLKIVLAPNLSDSPIAIGFSRDDDDPTQASMLTLLPGASHGLSFADPIAGDLLMIVPAAAGRAEITPRHYAEFALLPTAAGLVVAPLSDDLAVDVAGARVHIGRPGGLSITPSALPFADSPAMLARGGKGSPSYLDFAGRRASGSDFLDMERRLRERIAALKPEEATQARLALARFYLANEFAAETLGLINLIQKDDPGLEGNAQLQTMHAAADYMMGRYRDAHNDIVGAAFDNDRHAMFWRGLIDAAMENWDGARAALNQAEPVFKQYPAEWRARAQIAMAKAALASNSIETADAVLGKLPRDLPKPLMLEAEVTRAELYAQEGRAHAARVLFAAVENSDDDRAAAEATYGDISSSLSAGMMTPPAAIEALERLRFRWRGDALELKTVRKLGSLYFASAQWRKGLETLRVAAQNFPNDDQARQAEDDMRSAFTDLFLKGKADKMPPIESLALFYDFIDLTPIGPDGDDMIRRMSDRLVAIDLLGPAEKLLDYQVNKRLDGVARAQVATRLAMIYLMDKKPEQAADALRASTISGLPDDLNQQRMLLQARALAGLKEWEQAQDLLALDTSPDAQRLRADIYWESGNWAQAAANAEQLLGNRWQEATPLTDDERKEAMRAAVAYSLADNQAGLDRLRAHFMPKMQSSPDANAFAVVTQNIDMQGTAFRDAAGQVASIDTLQAFMKDFRKHYAAADATN
jgi:hypothetical protein